MLQFLNKTHLPCDGSRYSWSDMSMCDNGTEIITKLDSKTDKKSCKTIYHEILTNSEIYFCKTDLLYCRKPWYC